MNRFASTIGFVLFAILFVVNLGYEIDKYLAEKAQVERFIQNQENLSIFEYAGKAYAVEVMADNSFYNPSHAYLQAAPKIADIDSVQVMNGHFVNEYDVLQLSSDFPDVWKKVRTTTPGRYSVDTVQDKVGNSFSMGPRLWVFLSFLFRLIGIGLFSVLPTVLAGLQLTIQLGLIPAGLVMLVSLIAAPNARGQYPSHTAKVITTWQADSMGVSRSITPSLFRFQKHSAYFAAVIPSGVLAGGGPTLSIRDTLAWAGRTLNGFVLPAVTASITPRGIADEQFWLISKLSAGRLSVKTKSFITTPLIAGSWFVSSENRVWAAFGTLRAGLQAKIVGWKDSWQTTAGPFAARSLTDRLEVLLQTPVHSQPRTLTFELTYSF